MNPSEPSPQHFAQQCNALYHALYRLAARRVDEGQGRLSTETTALLAHLAQSGPLTLSEMAQHLGRALSTLSVKVSGLESQGLLARQTDENDGRRVLIWLSPEGRQALAAATQVLDTASLARAAAALDTTQRTQLLAGLQALVNALSTQGLHALHPERKNHEPEL